MGGLRGLMALLVIGAACQRSPDEDTRVAPDLRPGAAPVPEMGRTAACENEAAGVRLVYPATWHTNRGDALPPCSLFHPEPVGSLLARAEGVPAEIAIVIVREPLPFEKATEVPKGEMWLAREKATVAGREAERSEIIPGDELLTRGDRTYRYHVDLDGETLIATTRETGDIPFEQKRRVLDEMMRRLELLDGAGRTRGNGTPVAGGSPE